MGGVFRKTFDGRDRFAGNFAHLRLARERSLAVDVNHASAAQAGAATEFRATELQSFADHPEKRSRGWRVRGLGFSVDCETDHHALPISATRPAGKAERLLSPAPRFHSTVCEVANNLPGGQGITGTLDVGRRRAGAPRRCGARALLRITLE